MGFQGKHFTSDSASATASTGLKNYIVYPNFENGSTLGWSLGTTGTIVNGLPTGTPTFGSGASANLSISTVSSGQLSGRYSMQYQHVATQTVQGNMVSTDALTIDSSDQARVLAFKFNYKASVNPSNGNFSGTSLNSFAVAIYDVSNNAWLGTAGQFNIVQSSGVGQCTGTFQTAINTTSIRLVFYNAQQTSNVVGGGAITMLLDDFFLGPQVTSIAPAMNDWTNFTATGAWTTNTTYTGRYKRVGDSALIEYYWSLTGAPNGVAQGLNMPPGLVMDVTKMANGSTPGNTYRIPYSTGSMLRTAISEFALHAFWGTTTGFAVTYLVPNSTTNINDNPSLTATAPYTFASGDYGSMTIQVPIVGWSSNTISSADSDTRVVAARYYVSVNVATGANTPINYDTKVIDTHGAVTTGVGVWKFTAPVSGTYQVSTVTANATGNTAVYLTKNGSNVSYLSSLVLNAAASGSTLVSCVAGDTLAVNNETASTITGSAVITSISIQRLSGPAVVQASESVAASAYNTSAQSISNTTFTTITGWTKYFDTHGAFNTSGVFTAPISGKYRFSGMLIYGSSSLTAGNELIYLVQQAGSSSNPYRMDDKFVQTTVTTLFSLSGSVTIQMLAGDTASIQTYQSTGGSKSLSSSTSNQIFIERVGN